MQRAIISAEMTAALATAMVAAGASTEVAATGTKNFIRALGSGTAATKRQTAAFATLGLDAKTRSKVTPKASDSYFTDQPLLSAVAELWPEGPDLDPCWEEGCFVSAKKVYDIRKGEDSRILPWTGRVFCNAPFSDLSSFAAKAAAHGLAGGECLFVCPVSSGTRWFQTMVLPHAVVCLLNGRAKFWKAGASKPSPSMTSICVAFFSADPEKVARFIEVFSKLGTVIEAVKEAA